MPYLLRDIENTERIQHYATMFIIQIMQVGTELDYLNSNYIQTSFDALPLYIQAK